MKELLGTPESDERPVETALFADALHGRSEQETDIELPCGSGEISAILHHLNNALVSILLNAQVVEFRLPSYSRLKRNLHELERSAQRASVLVKRLLQRVAITPVRQSWVANLVETAFPEPAVIEQGLPSQPRGKDEAVVVSVRDRKKVPHTIV